MLRRTEKKDSVHNNNRTTKEQHKAYKTTRDKIRAERRHTTHKMFLRKERAIQKALNMHIDDRSRGIYVRDICRDAGISSPTFYAHNENIDAAYRHYEENIIQEFIDSIQEDTSRSAIMAHLATTIYKNRDYFRKTLKNSEYYTAGKMIDHAKVLLVGPRISDSSYLLYRNEIISLLAIWATQDHFRKSEIDNYLHRIMRVRVKEWR